MALIPGWLADLLGVRAAVDSANVEYPQRRLWRFLGGVTVVDNPITGTTDIFAGGGLGFRGEYYVDPAFLGVELGSASNPFRSINAAFAYAASVGVTGGKIFTTSITENVTFPLTGDWEISGTLASGALLGCTITGNVVCSSTVTARRTLTNLRVAGNLSGNAGTAAQSLRVLLDSATVEGSTTLTKSGSGIVRLGTRGGVTATSFLLPTVNMGYAFLVGPVSVAGTVWAHTASFGSTLACSGRSSFSSSIFNGNITANDVAAGDVALCFSQCQVTSINVSLSQSDGGLLALVSASDSNFDDSSFVYSGIGINLFSVDRATANSFYGHGGSVSGLGSAGVGAATCSALRRRVALSANVSPTTLVDRSPFIQQRVNATLTLVTPGTAGSAVLNIIYTDSLGVSRTKPVTSALNIAGSVGDEAQGSLVFTQDGSAQLQYSVTGITTPGALSYNLCVSVEA